MTISNNEEHDVFFSVRHEDHVRTAQILLRNVAILEECGVPNVAYRLKDGELEFLLGVAGFELVECLSGGLNSHFPLRVARAV